MRDSYSKPILFYCLGVFLMGGYALIGTYMLQPKVSANYRAFFIDGTSNCWAAQKPHSLKPLAQMPFGVGQIGHNCQI